MDIFRWIAVILFIIMSAEVIKYYIKHKSLQKDESKHISEHEQKLIALEERIKILEQIVTDPSEDLKKKFDDL